MIQFNDCWAKTTEMGQPGVSVFHHCLNVGMVAAQLARASMIEQRSAVNADGVGLLAALHDIGKVSPGFQQKCAAWIQERGLYSLAEKERWCRHESDHSKVSQYSIGQLLAARGMKRKFAHAWATAIGAHHGSPHGYSESGLSLAGVRSDFWEGERQALSAELEQVFGALPLVDFAPAAPQLWALAGLISVGDWIGSDETWFPPDANLPVEESRARAARAIGALRFAPEKTKPGMQFGQLFGSSFSPNSLQQAARSLVQKPGVYVFEAPMGMGKTEAALACAYGLIAAGQAHGLYFALPTQATSNRIHARIEPFVTRITDGARGVRLIHGASWLREDMHAPVLRPAAGDAEGARRAREAAAWFRGAKRALLEPFGVGTVDQALLSVVAAKHFFVRTFALAGKVVVLDEIHSYDGYTGTLVDALITQLRELGSTVIILTATLTRRRLAELLDLSEAEVAALPDGFPRIVGRAYGDPAVLHAPAQPPSSKTVRVAFPMPEAAMEDALVAARAGACVLWICNTVAAAQATAGKLASLNNQGGPRIGLLHARFPFFQREKLETKWLAALGPPPAKRPAGCILVSTQIVEQSVDVDADLLVTELAPTDMILQRIGRLWRHQRARPLPRPEVWVLAESASLEELRGSSVAEIREVLGSKGRVYAPYVLLRSLAEWGAREEITLPGDIRPMLEATYAVRDDDPAAWTELGADMEKQRAKHVGQALTATNFLHLPVLSDDEGVQTRLNTQPMIAAVIAADASDESAARLLNGDIVNLRARDFCMATARALHRNLVKLPAFWFGKGGEVKGHDGLARHGVISAALLEVATDGTLSGAGFAPGISLRLTPFLGVESIAVMVPKGSRHLPEYDEPND